jgi:hypothetical protein
MVGAVAVKNNQVIGTRGLSVAVKNNQVIGTRGLSNV